jgi:hypothetical protein
MKAQQADYYGHYIDGEWVYHAAPGLYEMSSFLAGGSAE